MRSLLHYRNCLMAGACAAGGSFFGKLPSVLSSIELFTGTRVVLPFAFYIEFVILRTIPLILMIFCNILNWRYFLKALQKTEQTLTVTVLTAASNYVISFFLGVIIYGEAFSIFSAAGCCLIIAGLWLLCDSSDKTNQPQKKIN